MELHWWEKVAQTTETGQKCYTQFKHHDGFTKSPVFWHCFQVERKMSWSEKPDILRNLEIFATWLQLEAQRVFRIDFCDRPMVQRDQPVLPTPAERIPSCPKSRWRCRWSPESTPTRILLAQISPKTKDKKKKTPALLEDDLWQLNAQCRAVRSKRCHWADLQWFSQLLIFQIFWFFEVWIIFQFGCGCLKLFIPVGWLTHLTNRQVAKRDGASHNSSWSCLTQRRKKTCPIRKFLSVSHSLCLQSSQLWSQVAYSALSLSLSRKIVKNKRKTQGLNLSHVRLKLSIYSNSKNTQIENMSRTQPFFFRLKKNIQVKKGTSNDPKKIIQILISKFKTSTSCHLLPQQKLIFLKPSHLQPQVFDHHLHNLLSVEDRPARDLERSGRWAQQECHGNEWKEISEIDYKKMDENI